ncbi:Protein CBG25280 [Caenorhabditis briggsae]|uniref:Protein CBG25280 n=1 Tax=Caenorhabditis briggsae TaxID=6238 RepID=B6IIJ8_CAEBR|nr:Protein CBG25280 [Caenorhabditis briggsae]CAR99728.1 Protein CBG25280 [Caenorhabditis briggsae]
MVEDIMESFIYSSFHSDIHLFCFQHCLYKSRQIRWKTNLSRKLLQLDFLQKQTKRAMWIDYCQIRVPLE